jgi:hypothetical protein
MKDDIGLWNEFGSIAGHSKHGTGQVSWKARNTFKNENPRFLVCYVVSLDKSDRVKRYFAMAEVALP